jgi:hypothetical protein
MGYENGKNSRKEILKRFASFFTLTTNIKVYGELVHGDYVLFFDRGQLDYNDLENINKFLMGNFYVKGMFTHTLPSLGVYHHRLGIRFSSDLVEERFER